MTCTEGTGTSTTGSLVLGSTLTSLAPGGVLREVETVVLPPGASEVKVEPKTSDPVVLVPVPSRQVPVPSAQPQQ